MTAPLPPLPSPALNDAHQLMNVFAFGYHKDQMRDYAKLAVREALERAAHICEMHRLKISDPIGPIYAEECETLARAMLKEYE